MIFFLKNGIPFINKEKLAGAEQENGLIYGDATVADLINKDTDLDGVPDWEEPLWGLDPTKKETAPGISDITVVNKLKIEQGLSAESGDGESQSTENLTETDKFSRELFSTVATLIQTGAMDQEAVDKISNSLAEHIQNTVPRKVFFLSDIKVIEDASVGAVKKYNDTLDNIVDKQYPISQNATEVFQKFIIDENNVDVNALSELDPIINQRNKIISAIANTNVPRPLASLHLDFLNALQRLSENLSDIKFYDSDAIVALSGISQYNQNTTLLQSAINKLRNAIEQKLNN